MPSTPQPAIPSPIDDVAQLCEGAPQDLTRRLRVQVVEGEGNHYDDEQGQAEDDVGDQR